MSLEKLYSKNEEREKEKKSLDAHERFIEEQRILRESSDLLQSLALKISQEFDIDITEVKEIIKWDTLWNLEWLKNTLWKNIDVQEFQKAINTARETISNLSKKNRERLMELIEIEENSPENFQYNITSKYFSQQQKRALYPETLWDQVLWVWLGIIDTAEAVILFLYWLGKWVLLTPYHLYLIITGQAQLKKGQK